MPRAYCWNAESLLASKRTPKKLSACRTKAKEPTALRRPTLWCRMKTYEKRDYTSWQARQGRILRPNGAEHEQPTLDTVAAGATYKEGYRCRHSRCAGGL